MSMRITLAVVMAALVFAAPTARSRDNSFTFKFAQYCLQQDDVPREQTVFCRG